MYKVITLTPSQTPHGYWSRRPLQGDDNLPIDQWFENWLNTELPKITGYALSMFSKNWEIQDAGYLQTITVILKKARHR